MHFVKRSDRPPPAFAAVLAFCRDGKTEVAITRGGTRKVAIDSARKVAKSTGLLSTRERANPSIRKGLLPQTMHPGRRSLQDRMCGTQDRGALLDSDFENDERCDARTRLARSPVFCVHSPGVGGLYAAYIECCIRRAHRASAAQRLRGRCGVRAVSSERG
jgi:hypothetical protein